MDRLETWRFKPFRATADLGGIGVPKVKKSPYSVMCQCEGIEQMRVRLFTQEKLAVMVVPRAFLRTSKSSQTLQD